MKSEKLSSDLYSTLPLGRLNQLHLCKRIKTSENYIARKGFDPKIATNNFLASCYIIL